MRPLGPFLLSSQIVANDYTFEYDFKILVVEVLCGHISSLHREHLTFRQYITYLVLIRI